MIYTVSSMDKSQCGIETKFQVMQTIVLFMISNLPDVKNMILKTEPKLFVFVDMRYLLHPSKSLSLSMVLVCRV